MRFEPRASFATPAEGAGDGAGRGAAAAGRALAEFSAGAIPGKVGVPVVIGAVITAPFAVTGGALLGALRAEPAAVVQEATRTLVAAWGGLRPHSAVRDEVLRLAGANRTPYAFVLLPDPLERQGVATVLEIDVLTMSLKAHGTINPPFTLVMRVHNRLVAADGAELEEWTLESESVGRNFVKWTENDAALLREEAARAARSLGTRIVTRFRADCRTVGAMCRW